MNALTLAFTCLIYHPVISVSARAGTVELITPLGVGTPHYRISHPGVRDQLERERMGSTWQRFKSKEHDTGVLWG